jgi:hypothetical protein
MDCSAWGAGSPSHRGTPAPRDAETTARSSIPALRAGASSRSVSPRFEPRRDSAGLLHSYLLVHSSKQPR